MKVFYLNYCKSKSYKLCLLVLVISFNFLTNWNAKLCAQGQVVYPNESVLSSGQWTKYAVNQSGLHSFTYNQLLSDGVISSALPSNQLRVYGNGTGYLPFSNSDFHPTELLQVPILIEDGNDGNFGPGDRIFFYANAADKIDYDQSIEFYRPRKKYFDEANYYFVSGSGSKESQKRIAFNNSDLSTCDEEINQHIEIRHHEEESRNLIKSGRRKYGETFDFTTERTFSFNLDNKVSNDVKYLVSAAASSSATSSSFTCSINGSNQTTTTIWVSSQYSPVRRAEILKNVDIQQIEANFKITFNKPNSSSVGYLDEIIVNYKASNLNAKNDVWVFSPSLNPALNYCISVPNAEVWDVSDHNNVEALIPSNGKISSLVNTNTRILVANKSEAFRASKVSQIENQNLHALSNIDYLIVAPKIFLDEANRLAEFHRSEGLSVAVVDVEKIYNEFSSGAVDIGGIRNFVKHLFFSPASAANPLRYLLLFGDASYNNNFSDRNLFLPTYQSLNSEVLTSSYVTDDFFGFLDPNEGESGKDLVDIGIGRFPVSNLTQAKNVVDKVLHYANASGTEALGAWRNKVVFVADDQSGEPRDSNTELIHMRDANVLASNVENSFEGFDVRKIFLDAYKQTSTPGGDRYPEASRDIAQAVENGALIVNYTGHGGELGWAHERILDIPTINSWTNKDKLTLMVTATCEFSRFDDPDRISGGEHTLLNPNGGAIALFTTTRLVFAAANFRISQIFYRHAFPTEDQPDLRLGDIMRLTKRDISLSEASSNPINHLNFALLGDPALRLAYPKNKVITTKINGVDLTTGITDTIKALQKVKVEGIVADFSEGVLASFNGDVEITVNDKKSNIRALQNDRGSLPFQFDSWDRTIYKGRAAVNNGRFSFEFIAPRDIVFNFGEGRFMYYAKSSDGSDANGSYSDVIIGGQSDNVLLDDEGPEIDLFLNNLRFNPGDEVGDNALLLAFLTDSSGINTTGNGIGHDILAFIDDDTQNSFVLNDFFTADLNSYQSGVVRFPVENLSKGEHTLTVRAWDINNNPSENTTRFIVSDGSGLSLNEVFNFPNPVNESTTFSFKSNAGNEIVTATVRIFDINGRLVDTVSKDFLNGSFGNEGLKWNLNESQGNISTGTFVYALELTNQAGQRAMKTNTMVIIR